MGHRSVAALATACALAVILTALAPSGAGAPVPAPPFKSGTKWTQRHTLITPAGEKRIGTISQVYRGQEAYRGRTYHSFDTSTTLAPGAVERSYAEWDGAHFSEAVVVTTDAQHNVTEIVFDRGLVMGVPVTYSGNAQIFVNGTQTATLPWNYTAAPREPAKITVPAGTFQTTRWDVEIQLGQLDTQLSIFNVGIMAVRRDSKEYVNGSLAATTSLELMSGPVR